MNIIHFYGSLRLKSHLSPCFGFVFKLELQIHCGFADSHKIETEYLEKLVGVQVYYCKYTQNTKSN